MKMNEICQRSGLQKRTIHFYIKERIIEPMANASNGYYEFSEEDLKKLLLTKQLRHAGFSIDAIRSILNTPQSTEYYISMRRAMISRQIAYLEKTGRALDSIIMNLPFHPSIDDLYQDIMAEELPIPPEETIPKEEHYYDNHLTNHFLWRGFLTDEHLSEYQQFLWNKILKKTADPSKNPEQYLLCQYLSSLNNEQIAALYNTRNENYHEVYLLKETDLENYAKKIIHALRIFSQSDKMIQLWKQNYHTFYHVNAYIYASSLAKTAQEMLPFLKTYTDNINKATQLTYDYLTSNEGLSLYQELKQKLGDDLDFENNAHGELEAIHTLVKEYN